MYCNASIEIKLSVGFQTFYFFISRKCLYVCTSNFKSHKSMEKNLTLKDVFSSNPFLGLFLLPSFLSYSITSKE